MGFRRVTSFKWKEAPWPLYQTPCIRTCFSWLLLLPIALSCGAGGKFVHPYDAYILYYWPMHSYGSNPSRGVQDTYPIAYYSSLKQPKVSVPAQLGLLLPCRFLSESRASSMSVCPSPRPSHPEWCSAPLCVPMATAEPLCSALGNFPLSRPPPCNKLSQSGFPTQPLVGVGTGWVLFTLSSQYRGWRSSLAWGICMLIPRTHHVS